MANKNYFQKDERVIKCTAFFNCNVKHPHSIFSILKKGLISHCCHQPLKRTHMRKLTTGDTAETDAVPDYIENILLF